MLRILKFWRWPLPITFLILYLGTIFLFACVYYWMPGQFYHSTIRHEASMRADEQYIKGEWMVTIVNSYKQEIGGSSIVKGKDGWIASVEDLMLTSMTYENRAFLFYFRLPKRTDSRIVPPISDTPLWIRVPEHYYDNVAQDVERNMKEAGNGHSPFPPLPANWNAFELLGADQSGLKVIPKPLLPHAALVERMITYADAMDGFPGRSTGSFWRMFYLSAVTITTTGYGDIVPITTVARVLVASESIIGTIIIGLYLWALTEHLGKRRTQ